MSDKRQWVQDKLKEIEHKRDILRSLQEMLAKWEQDVDWGALPADKQAALVALADESVATLASMIENLGDKIRADLAELAGRNGEPDTNE
ncbi:hypothetical protein JW859_13950 [bacterium]|nr:hypothetical protein [bacterium]